jgi:hypothetical protein
MRALRRIGPVLAKSCLTRTLGELSLDGFEEHLGVLQGPEPV